MAVRQHEQDNVHTYRIPGLTTTKKGTLLASYDVRRDLRRDLQGDIDIGISRSVDGGQTWEPMRIALDMSTWGDLPEKFNGVSDACLLADVNTGDVYVAGLWMYGVINSEGKWLEGLTEDSTAWNHQWLTKGSQPGFGVKQTSQFLISKSEDDGITWGETENITRMGKQEEWWLYAPGPGHGIVMEDSTLVFPTQGRDENGETFSKYHVQPGRRENLEVIQCSLYQYNRIHGCSVGRWKPHAEYCVTTEIDRINPKPTAVLSQLLTIWGKPGRSMKPLMVR